MWEPLFARGDGVFVGCRTEPGIWVGRNDGEPKLARLEYPVFLWPMLEHDVVEVYERFDAYWPRFGLDLTPTDAIRLIATSAIASGRDYWASLAMDWLEKMLSRDQAPSLERGSIPEVDTGALSQVLRNRWRRLSK
ncbi:hypothetical protein AB0I91_34805 [Actinosynnema sp. NPDC049800]